jgi:lambda family phage portal protein
MEKLVKDIEGVKVTTYDQQALRDFFFAIRDRVIESATEKTGKRLRIRNSFDGAQITRLTHSWGAGFTSGDTEVRGGGKILRARARERARNDDYAKKFLRMVVINILGSTGINFQSKVKLANGKQDKQANERIETAFNDWGKRKNSPDVTGKLSWKGIQKAVVKAVARDGEILARKVKGFPNKYRYALQLIEADHLDESFNKLLPDGNEIRMGVELDEWKRPVAYWILVRHPGDFSFSTNKPRFKRVRIPADEIIHIYDPDRVNDTRGFTWMHTAMHGMRMLSGYEEAELVSARISACKMGSYQTIDGYPTEGDEDVEGEFLTDAEPGALPITPEGYELKPIDWNHPAGNYPPFVNQCVRRIAAGLGVAFPSLSGNSEKVNFSSIRSGTLEERDNWKERQSWFIEDLPDPVFDGFLEMFLLMRGNPYTIMDFDRLDAPKWTARAWDWVDPLKDMKANVEGLKARLLSFTEVFAERGKDFEEQVKLMADEIDIFKENGLEDFINKFFDGKTAVNSPEYNKLIDDDEDVDEEEETATTAPGKNRKNGRH